MAKQEVKKVSFKLDSYSVGVIMEEGRYRIKEARVVEWEYNGALDKPTIALKVDYHPVDAKNKDDANAKTVEQYYSIGDPEQFQPDEENTGIISIGTREKLSKSINFYVWLENIINGGFPEDKYDDDTSVFDGCIVNVVGIPAPERKGLKSSVSEDPNAPKREKIIYVVNSVESIPGEKGRPAAKAPVAAAKQEKKPAAPAKSKESNEDDEVVAALTEHLSTILADTEETIGVTKLRVKVHAAMTKAKVDSAIRDKATKIFINDPDTLTSVLADLGWASDDEGQISPV